MAKYPAHFFFGRDGADPDLDFRIRFWEQVNGKFGEYTMLAGHRTDNGQPVALHVMFAGLKRELGDLKPKEGERLVVAYRAQGETAAGHPFHKFAASCPDRGPGAAPASGTTKPVETPEDLTKRFGDDAPW